MSHERWIVDSSPLIFPSRFGASTTRVHPYDVTCLLVNDGRARVSPSCIGYVTKKRACNADQGADVSLLTSIVDFGDTVAGDANVVSGGIARDGSEVVPSA